MSAFCDLPVHIHRSELLVQRVALLENAIVARRDKHIRRHIARALLLAHSVMREASQLNAYMRLASLIGMPP